MGKTRLTYRFEGTYLHRGKDELVKRTKRPSETSLEAVAGRGLLVFIIRCVCLASRHPCEAHEVSNPCVALLWLREQPCS
jgi:hypothetical protein